VPWNKGKLVGQKAPFKPKEVWAIRARLQMQNRARELALFDLGIDSKLRACDLVKLRVRDVSHGDRVASRATVLQQKTQRPVQFEISPATREAVEAWMRKAGLRPDDYLFPSRVRRSPHLGTRQYARLPEGWVSSVGLDPAGLRDPLDAAHQGCVDLPPDEEPASRAAAARAQQAGEHGQVPRH
jgi:integrase